MQKAASYRTLDSPGSSCMPNLYSTSPSRTTRDTGTRENATVIYNPYSTPKHREIVTMLPINRSSSIRLYHLNNLRDSAAAARESCTATGRAPT